MEILTAVRIAIFFRRSIGGVVAAFFIGIASSFADAQEQYLEYAVKATYLYKFEPFIDWPPGAFAASDSPLVICIAGRDPFGETIDRTVSNVMLGARHIVVRRPPFSENDLSCHIVFIGGSSATVKKWLAMTRGKPMLTVTEMNSADTETGIINFVTVNEHVRFAIDSAAATRSGLVLSTKLLALATAVKTASNEARP